MSHFALLWKARSIEKYRLKYENEKIRSIILSNAEIPDRTLFQRWTHYRHDLSRHISRTFSRWYPEGTTVSNFLVHIKDDMKFPQILLRSLFGFTGGLILTYLCFIFFVFQLSLSLVNATVLSSIIGVLLTLGLTFSNRMRCLMFLLIPQLFSRVGRYTLTCYALVLILTGPATNTLRNLEVLSESMACSQEHIKTHYKQLNDYIRTPFNSIKLSLDLMIERLRKITSKLKVALIDVNRVIITISSIIQSTFVWLDKVTKSCNHRLGTPHHRCMMALMKSAQHKCTNCKYSETCTCPSFVNFAKKTCEQLGPYKSFCFPNNYSGETFVATIRTKLRHFIDRISQLMSLHIKVYHSYSFVGNSGPDSPVTAGIVTEMRNRADPLLTWLSWSSCVTSLFLLLIIFRAKHYQRMYESRSRFDNRYITNEFRALDLKRLREGRETVLPLNRRERAKYVTTTSFRLVASEKVYINRSVIFMIITTFKLMIHIVADYSLYWVLMMIRYHGTKETLLKPGIPDTGIRVSGHGFVAKFLRSSLKTMNIPLMFPSFSNKSCLPNPQPPDYKRYTQIGILIVLLWFFALFEPYGLRLRHIIVGHYRPERAKTRALWLYNYILRTRGSFMKLARRKLHREFKYSSETKYTLRSWIRSVIPFLWLQRMLGVIEEQSKCLLCNATKDSNDPHTTIIRCDVPNCPGTYCTKCFSDIGEMCTICLPPLDYVDLSDVSMEKGSSDEDSNDDEVPNTSANNAAKEQQNDSSEDSGSQPKQINRVIEQEDHTESSDSSKSSGHRESRDIYPLLDRNYRISNRTLHNTVYKENCRSKIRDHRVSEDKNLCPAYKTNITTRFKSSRCSITRFKFSNYNNLSFLSVYIALSGPNIMPIKHTSLHPINIVPEKFIENLKKSTEDFVITCNNNKGDDNKKIKKNKKREKSVENKDSKKKNKKSKKDRKSISKSNPNGDEAEKPTKKEKKLKSERSRKRSTHTLHSIKQYCKKMFVYMLPNKKEPNIQPSDSKKQKKKKKRKKEKDKIIIHKSETEYKSTIRLFDRGRVIAYLTELDWIMNTKKDKSRKIRPKCPNFFEDETPKDVVKFNDIIIPKLNLDFTLETFCYDDTHATRTGRSSSVEHMQYKSKTNYSRNAIERFFKKALKSNNSDGSKKGSPDYNYDRPMKYFTSIGHHDFLSNIDLTFTDLNDIERLLASQSQAFIDKKEVEKKKDEDNEKEKVPDNNFIENVEQEQEKNEEEGEEGEEAEGQEGEDGEEGSSEEEEEEEEREVNNENDEMEEIKDAITENEEKTESKKDYFWMPKESLSNLSFKLSQFSRRPISMVKGLCNAMLVPSDVKICQRLRGHRKHSGEKTTDKKISDATKLRKVDDKDIMACPNTCSCATQKNLPRRHYTKSKESAEVPNTRYHASHKEYHCDVGVEVCNSTCTCATQCYISSRDVGTFRNGRLRQDEDRRYNSSRDTVSSMNESYTDSLISQTTESYLEISDVDDDDDDDDDKTDTTIYSLPTIDMSRGFNRHCINLGKKNNRSTSMMPRKYVDAYTITDDWWSPLLEKQNNFKVRLRSNNTDKSTSMSDDSDSCRSKTKEGSKRVVTFKSSAQIIPKTSAKEKEIGKTPSRLVLEIPRIYKTAEKNTSSSSRCCNYRRNRRAKRLEDRYSPRKLHNSKHKRTEVVRNSNKMR